MPMRSLKTALLTAVTFGLVGPLFGTIAFAVWGLAESTEPASGWAVLAILWMLPFGYMFGFVPAVLTGFLAGLVRGRVSSAVYVAASAIAGFAVTWGLATLTASGPDLDGGGVNLAIIGAIAGLCSGVVSSALGRRRRQPVSAGPAESD
ncbi:hypothetical protein [Brevundimonas sp.]|uniref:hypothetical protein n=1 Tax=Brevundimonas sp. TaxID=1871086 RepID=UPI0025DC2E39|nr:hypothetical protein [Brevundimonas sp.]